MSQEFSIELARLQDIPYLASIELSAATLLQGYAPASVLEEPTDTKDFLKAQTEQRLWVARIGDFPVGFALIEMLDEDHPHLQEINVEPTYGRRGIGRALMREICAWLYRASYSEITLTTFRVVPWNMPFYQKLGFEEILDASINPALAKIIRNETERGLDPKERVAMRYRKSLGQM